MGEFVLDKQHTKIRSCRGTARRAPTAHPRIIKENYRVKSSCNRHFARSWEIGGQVFPLAFTISFTYGAANWRTNLTRSHPFWQDLERWPTVPLPRLSLRQSQSETRVSALTFSTARNVS